MKWKYILFVFFLIFALVLYLSPDKKTSVDPDKVAKQNAAHDSFVGSAPTASKPYNILDYTKPAPKP